MIWSPIAPATYFFPFVGHIAIGDSQGNTYDFHGTEVIGKNNLLFGYPTKVLQMADSDVDDEVWDKAIETAILKYQHEVYSFTYDLKFDFIYRTNNCHSFAAYALNQMSLPQYKDKKFDNNNIMMMMFFKGHFLHFSAILKSWGPFALIVAAIVLIIVLLC